MDHKGKTRVLFVCIGNACRSPMAEAIARKEANDVIEASSAGFYPMGMIPEMTQTILERSGYSANGLRSKGLREIVSEEIDLVVNLRDTRGLSPWRSLCRLRTGRFQIPMTRMMPLIRELWRISGGV